jgi:hypothetical protein
MKIIKNMIKSKYQKIMKNSSYSPKIGVFTYDFRVFSYIFLMFFENNKI